MIWDMRERERTGTHSYDLCFHTLFYFITSCSIFDNADYISVKPLRSIRAEHVLGTCLLWARGVSSVSVFSCVHPGCWGALVKQAIRTVLEM